jgi:sugar (pentulose or hexulose) kinase
MISNASDPLIAVLDIGKTNAKLAFVDPIAAAEVWSTRRANAVIDTELGRELDVHGIERWLLDALRNAPHRDRIVCFVPIAHGAAAVLLDASGSVLAAPDYEDRRHEGMNAQYARQRDAFADTYSPSLPLGLNLGRQLFLLQHARAELFGRAAHLLLYPQYWAWRLSGAFASEVTSLGCHTDLWRPREAACSDLANRQGWTQLLPPRRAANDRVGALAAHISAASGIDPQCAVTCGIHDSNASYLKFLIGREHTPCTVVSSGTWTVVMANGGNLDRLREERDMLANVDAFGSPVPTARYMGGREYEAIAKTNEPPTIAGLIEVIRGGAMALPSFAAAGPFAGGLGKLIHDETLSGTARAALATLYSAAMTALLIESLGASGEILIDGPLAGNPLFGPLLAAFTSNGPVKLHTATMGGARAAVYLAGFAVPEAEALHIAAPFEMDGLRAYHAAWREQVLQR